MEPAACPFCSLSADRIRGSNRSALWIEDAYPVSPGHALLIPRRHVASLFDLSDSERGDLMDLLPQARSGILAERRPGGFNIGINEGAAAGQPVMHLHIHLIPRFSGDQPDPRGGVRWIFPGKADYWSPRR